jgi:hypothetical protein
MRVCTKSPSLSARPVTIVAATLNQLLAIAKPQRNFVAALLATMLALRGRVNYRNLARYGQYSERTYARQFQQPFPWLDYHAKLIQSAVSSTHELIAAQDASFPRAASRPMGWISSITGAPADRSAGWNSVRSPSWMSRKKALTSRR